MYTIEKNIPFVRTAKYKPSKYPCAIMKVGESFFVEKGKIETISSSIFRYNRILAPNKFAVRAFKNGVRVWRVA